MSWLALSNDASFLTLARESFRLPFCTAFMGTTKSVPNSFLHAA
jgi:hypothetical protein